METILSRKIGPIGAGFGLNKNSKSGHGGYDFVSPRGRSVYSPISGTVTEINKSIPGYGTYLEMQDDTTGLYHGFGHMSGINLKPGNKLPAGVKLGNVDNIGTKDPHLHYETATVPREEHKGIKLAGPKDGFGLVDPDFQQGGPEISIQKAFENSSSTEIYLKDLVDLAKKDNSAETLVAIYQVLADFVGKYTGSGNTANTTLNAVNVNNRNYYDKKKADVISATESVQRKELRRIHESITRGRT
jgi:murein DD-endopeptidase MepM/ murein hydrolase activator NlpD